MDEQLLVNTPEHVAFGYEIAGIGSRFLAALVDTTILAVLYLLVWVLILATDLLGSTIFNGEATGISSAFVGLLTVVAFGILWGYYIFFETFWHGQTPGKRLGRLRVIRQSGGTIGVWEAIIRNLVRFIDFLPLAYGFGVVSMFASDRARRLGDYAAGTVVVREGAPVTLAGLVARAGAAALTSGPAPLHPLALYMDVRRLSPADLSLVRELLVRLPTLPPPRAWQLAWEMTGYVTQRTGFTGQVHDPAAFLTAVVQAATGTNTGS